MITSESYFYFTLIFIESTIWRMRAKRIDSTYLLETDLAGSLTEALSADVEGVLSDDGMPVAANTAKERGI